VDAHRRRLRRYGVHMSGVSSIHDWYRIRTLVRFQPIKMDDGSLRLHRHVVGGASVVIPFYL